MAICTITRNGSIAALAKRQQSLYILKGRTCASESAYIVEGPSSLLNAEEPITALTACTYSSKATFETWHRRLAHIAPESVKKEKQVCKPCLEGKQARKPIPDESAIKNPRVLHRTYSDVCGPMETASRMGHRYFITFIDAKVYFERAEAETGERANYFRSDGGGEYGSGELHKRTELPNA